MGPWKMTLQKWVFSTEPWLLALFLQFLSLNSGRFWGYSLTTVTTPHFGVTSSEVAIICPNDCWKRSKGFLGIFFSTLWDQDIWESLRTFVVTLIQYPRIEEGCLQEWLGESRMEFLNFQQKHVQQKLDFTQVTYTPSGKWTSWKRHFFWRGDVTELGNHQVLDYAKKWGGCNYQHHHQRSLLDDHGMFQLSNNLSVEFAGKTLPETNSSPLQIGHNKRKRSYCNHPFSGALSFREGNSSVKIWSPPLQWFFCTKSYKRCPKKMVAKIDTFYRKPFLSHFSLHGCKGFMASALWLSSRSFKTIDSTTARLWPPQTPPSSPPSLPFSSFCL